MKLLIDDAHIDAIKKVYEYFPVVGVTTNPTILSKVGGNPFDTLRRIREFIGEEADLHVQAVSSQAEQIADEARHIVEILGANTCVKIPAVHGDCGLYAHASFYRRSMRREFRGSLRQPNRQHGL